MPAWPSAPTTSRFSSAGPPFRASSAWTCCACAIGSSKVAGAASWSASCSCAGPAVVLLPYDPRLDELVMIEQFRVGALEVGPSPWQMEFVAGIAEAGESMEAVARREAVEEAGLAVAEIVPVHRYQVSPGGNTEEIVVLCGHVDAAGAGGVHGVEHEHEDIRVHRVPFAAAQAALDGGELRNAAAIVGVQWLALHRDALRREWQP